MSRLDRGPVSLDHLFGVSQHPDMPMVEPQDPMGEGFDGIEVVGNQQDRGTSIHESLHAGRRFPLERFVPDRQDLVDYQDVGIDIGGHGKAESGEHA